MSNVIRLTQENGGELNPSAVDPRKTSDDADMPAEGVGHDLCAARQRSGKTLMDVWREIKIPPHHLIASETSRFDALPGHVYAIGFVRSYSAYLGLDPETSVARLRAEMSGSNAVLPVLGPLAPPPRKDPEAEFDRSGDAEEPMISLLCPPERKWPHSVAAGLLIAAVIYSGYYVVASARRMAPPPVIPVPARLAAEAGFTGKQAGTASLATVRQPARTSSELVLLPSTQLVPTEPITVPPLTPVALAPALTAKPALASSTKVAPTRRNSVRSLATIEPRFTSPPELALPPLDATSTQKTTILSVPGARFHSPLPLGQRYGMENRNARIILRVHRSIRLAVQGTDNRILIDRVLDAGDTYRVPNMTGLQLSASDAGAIEVILDDTTVGFAGKDGVMTRGLSLEPQSIIDRQQHG